MNLDPDASIARLRRHAWCATTLFSLGGLLVGFPFFLGALSGGVLAMLIFEAFGRFVKNLTGEKPTRLSWLGLFGVLFRYILLGIALFVIIGVWHANVVGVAFGLSAPVAAVFVECGLHAYQEFKAERETRQ